MVPVDAPEIPRHGSEYTFVGSGVFGGDSSEFHFTP